jgi:hypothetical protein
MTVFRTDNPDARLRRMKDVTDRITRIVLVLIILFFRVFILSITQAMKDDLVIRLEINLPHP